MRNHTLLLSALLLTGCSGAVALTAEGPRATAIAPQTVTATARLQQPGERRVQASDITPWTAADVDHVELTLSRDGATPPDVVLVPVALADLASPVTLSGLALNTPYTLTAKAFTSADVRIDALDAAPASCTTTFTTARTSPQDIGLIKLQLAGKVVDGSGRASAITVTDGPIQQPTATEAMEVAP